MENINDLTMKQAALKYAKQGILVFPVAPKNTMPLGNWNQIATSDNEQIEQWWNKNSKYNIGIKTGSESGVVVLRFKTDDAFDTAEKKGLPLTPTVRRDKGFDVYFKYQEDLYKLFDVERFSDVSIFSDDSHILAPPSVVQIQPPSSFYKPEVYSWCEGKSLDDLLLADMPSWLLKGCSESAEPVPPTNNEIVQQDQCEFEQVVITKEQNEDILQASEAIEVLVSDTKENNDIVPSNDNKSESVTDEWKAPRLFDKYYVDEIKADLLPSWLKDYAKAISESKETPEGLAVMLGLSMIATCVQKKFVVAPYGDDEYTETLSLWTATVLKSGERKSPVLSKLREPLVSWQREQAELLKDRIIETSTAITMAQGRIEKLYKDAVKQEDATEMQNRLNQINEIKRTMPVEVKAPVLWTGDINAEQLQDMLVDHDERMALLADEGNVFAVMAGLYNNDKVNMDIFLQAYSGIATRIDRRSRKAELKRPALTFGIAVQPTVIEAFAKNNNNQFRDKGAMARFLYCIPETMLGKRDSSRRVRVREDVKARYNDGIKRLLSIPTPDEPRMITLDDGAFETWVTFDGKNERSLVLGGELADMGDWGGKLPGNALRIAGLMHLVEHGADNTVIGRDTMANAVHLCELLIGHAKAAFGMAGAIKPNADAKKVFDWIEEQEFKTFTKSDCHNKFKSKPWDKEKLDNALTELVKRNIIKEQKELTSGKTATHYVSNPTLS